MSWNINQQDSNLVGETCWVDGKYDAIKASPLEIIQCFSLVEPKEESPGVLLLVSKDDTAKIAHGIGFAASISMDTHVTYLVRQPVELPDLDALRQKTKEFLIAYNQSK